VTGSMAPMRRLAALLTATVLAALVLPVVRPEAAYAAECPPFRLRQVAAGADAVFHARVVGPAEPTGRQGMLRYRVNVEVPFDGAARGEVEVFLGSGPCRGERLTVGANYVFFVADSGGRLVAAGNRPAVRPYSETFNDRLHEFFGSTAGGSATPGPSSRVSFGAPMVDEPRDFTRVAAPGAAIFLVGVLGLLLVRRFARH